MQSERRRTVITVRARDRSDDCYAARRTLGLLHTLKILVFLAESKKSVFLPVFSFKPNSFRGPGGFCWRIGVTAALLGRLLPSDGHKLVKKPEI
mgnify:CR=1 FL=1